MVRFQLHGYGEFTPAHGTDKCRWPHFDLLFVHEGHLRMHVGGHAPVDMPGGASVLLYPDTPFEGFSLADVTRASVMHFAIEPDDAGLRMPLARLANLKNGCDLHSAAAGRRAEPDVHRAMKLAGLPRLPLVHEMRIATLVLVLAELSEQATSMDGPGMESRFAPVIAWAAAHLNQGITVDHLAERAGLSSSRFRTLFRAEMNQSAGAFLQEMRLNEAARLLRETRTPIKSISRSSGYQDIAGFYHAFQQRYGMTPATFRQRYTPVG